MSEKRYVVKNWYDEYLCNDYDYSPLQEDALIFYDKSLDLRSGERYVRLTARYTNYVVKSAAGCYLKVEWTDKPECDFATMEQAFAAAEIYSMAGGKVYRR
jgi:hypothetical protein